MIYITHQIFQHLAVKYSTQPSSPVELLRLHLIIRVRECQTEEVGWEGAASLTLLFLKNKSSVLET